jgi:tight adherence protein B
MFTILMAFVLTGVFVGGIVYAAMPYFTGEVKAERRIDAVTKRTAMVTMEPDAKRRNVAEVLKKAEDLQARQKRPPLEARIEQAGLSITKNALLALSVAGGLLAFLTCLTISGSLLVSGGCFFIVTIGLPNWVLSYLIKKRLNRFIVELPGALDIITRGIKAGLPLSECLKIIANEAPDPIGPEFTRIIESQQMGISLSDAVQRMALRMPSSEANFFATAISIQQKSGGNLAEALENLAHILRSRKQMKLKIKAMSTEATASAGIIACMPPGVAIMVYMTSPDYISLLWTHTTVQVTLLISAIWMLIGVLVMRKMINFEF